MATVSRRQISQIAQRQLRLRSSLWRDVEESKLWDRKRSDGWLSIPRAIPLLAQIMDNLSKGKPVSSTYLDLWCRTYDNSFVIASKQREMAYFSGFTGERAIRTWTTRMRILEKFGFIDIKEGPHGPISYVLIFNPYHAVKPHLASNSGFANALIERMIEIGAKDLDEPNAPS